MYAVFPYRRHGINKPSLDMARRTFKMRRVKGNTGWNQDETQAALLGLAEEARRGLDDRLRRKHEGSRFPAFWGPNYDWVPDQDHGGNAMTALQTMLLQADETSSICFPPGPRTGTCLSNCMHPETPPCKASIETAAFWNSPWNRKHAAVN